VLRVTSAPPWLVSLLFTLADLHSTREKMTRTKIKMKMNSKPIALP